MSNFLKTVEYFQKYNILTKIWIFQNCTILSQMLLLVKIRRIFEVLSNFLKLKFIEIFLINRNFLMPKIWNHIKFLEIFHVTTRFIIYFVKEHCINFILKMLILLLSLKLTSGTSEPQYGIHKILQFWQNFAILKKCHNFDKI